jgi:hypothetical protein
MAVSKWRDAFRPLKRPGEELAARRSPGLRRMTECRGRGCASALQHTLGERALGAVLPLCLALREGKWEFEDLISDEDPQVELLRVFVAFEPHYAGGFLFRRDGP